MRATWLPGQYQCAHDGHQRSGTPVRVTRPGTSPRASNDERAWSATLHLGHRLQGAPAGMWAPATARTAVATSFRGTRTTGTLA